jgi:penicillin-binding protein 1A
MSLRKIFVFLIVLVFLGCGALAGTVFYFAQNLPQMITLKDYEPLLVSEVFDRKGRKVGEFFREKRILTPYKDIPQSVVHAFVSAEDGSFFKHGGINYFAILRAFAENIQAGRKKQGASTITQQVARSLLLSSEKTYVRKIKEILLAYRMESHLSKEDILYLYLNQIYLGQGAYGVAAAADVYFRKPLKNITLGEAALIAGLPQAPSRYSPVYNPARAKDRQIYVLNRMADDSIITKEQAKKTAAEPLRVFVRENFQDKAPFYLETVRQLLVKKLGEVPVLDRGLKIYTGLDLDLQVAAQEDVRKGLRDLDKRQGYRGPLKHIESAADIAALLKTTRDDLIDDQSPERIIRADGTIQDKGQLNLTGLDKKGAKLPNVPSYLPLGKIIDGVVTKVDDHWGLVYVRFAESKGLIDLETMKWASHPDPNIQSDARQIKRPSEALKKGDVIKLQVTAAQFSSERLDRELSQMKKKAGRKYVRPTDLPVYNEYAEVTLEQLPQVESALISFDQGTSDVVAMVGGYDFAKSEFNRTLQAARQTGSGFKPIVYASALDKGFTPATPILDAPIVFEEESDINEGQEDTKTWKPTNIGKKFEGDILFRNALIRSLNVPTVKIIEKVGVEWATNYARRLGIFSPLNPDFTLALGSSSVTLYEMARAFASFGRLGKRIRPILVHRVLAKNGKDVLLENLSLDERFETEIAKNEDEFEKRRLAYLAWKKQMDARGTAATGPAPQLSPIAGHRPDKEPPLFFEDPDLLMKPQTAYVLTTLLQGVVEERVGTGQRARALGRPVAGKTGSTNGYYDGWFVGFTPDYVTGVWCGFDDEKSMGRGETGGHTALPIWVEYMKAAHKDLPNRSFAVPEGIVFANIDNHTGQLASASSKDVVRQAFIEGSEPGSGSPEQTQAKPQEETDFYKEDATQ